MTYDMGVRAPLKTSMAPLAQWPEHSAVNRGVGGSNPPRSEGDGDARIEAEQRKWRDHHIDILSFIGLFFLTFL